jgi:hypothetical protein
VSLDMPLAMSLVWHLSRDLRRFGGTDRSTGLTPGPGQVLRVGIEQVCFQCLPFLVVRVFLVAALLECDAELVDS